MGLRRNIVASYAGQGYVTLLSIAALPFYLRALGAEAYGLVGFFSMLQAWFMLLDIGLTPTLSRETARFHGGALSAVDYRGFVRVLDSTHLAIADLGGNNRIDSMRNIVDTGRVGMLFVAPGRSETVRVNGEAWVTTDPDLLDSFTLPRRPVAAIVVRVTATFIHCAKAFKRSGMWDPNVWAVLAGSSDAADIIACQYDGAFEAELVRNDLAKGYDLALRWEAGEDVEV